MTTQEPPRYNPWARDVNRDGDTLADVTVERVGDIRDYLDLIAECLVALAEVAAPDAGRRRSHLKALRDF